MKRLSLIAFLILCEHCVCILRAGFVSDFETEPPIRNYTGVLEFEPRIRKAAFPSSITNDVTRIFLIIDSSRSMRNQYKKMAPNTFWDHVIESLSSTIESFDSLKCLIVFDGDGRFIFGLNDSDIKESHSLFPKTAASSLERLYKYEYESESDPLRGYVRVLDYILIDRDLHYNSVILTAGDELVEKKKEIKRQLKILEDFSNSNYKNLPLLVLEMPTQRNHLLAITEKKQISGYIERIWNYRIAMRILAKSSNGAYARYIWNENDLELK